MKQTDETIGVDGLALLDGLLEASVGHGATAADAQLARNDGESVSVRGDKLETVERDESLGVALRCFVGQRQASVSGQDLSPEGLSDLAARCVSMAKLAPEDPYAGLADEAELARELPHIDMTGDTDLDVDRLEVDAREAEAAAMEVDRVSQVASCSAGWSRSTRWLAATNGFRAQQTSGLSSLGLAAIATENDKMERDYDSRTTRRRADRPAPSEIGRIAAERAVARLGSRKISSQKAPVIYDKRLSAGLLAPLVSAISGPSVARGVSFLKDKLGQRVFHEGVHVMDDPFRERGLGARPHDGEGRPVTPARLVEDGMLMCFLHNGASARQMNAVPNGYASTAFGGPPGVSPSNLHLEAGEVGPKEAMRQVGMGLLVTDSFGPSINANTGDYSVGVAGFWFENGEVAFPVSEVTVAGNLIDMFARLQPLSDLEFRGATNAPSILIEDMSLAGS